MRQEERHRVGAFAFLMNEVQVDPAERHLELPEAVEGGFLRAPVEAVAPIGDEFLYVGNAAAG
jgi:hypothetical protein